jgi:hypothetical protein
VLGLLLAGTTARCSPAGRDTPRLDRVATVGCYVEACALAVGLHPLGRDGGQAVPETRLWLLEGQGASLLVRWLGEGGACHVDAWELTPTLLGSRADPCEGRTGAVWCPPIGSCVHASAHGLPTPDVNWTELRSAAKAAALTGAREVPSAFDGPVVVAETRDEMGYAAAYAGAEGATTTAEALADLRARALEVARDSRGRRPHLPTEEDGARHR